MDEKCNHNYIKTEWIFSCEYCGQMTDQNPEYYQVINRVMKTKYSKVNYLKEKLDFINGNNLVRDQHYKTLIDQLKNYEFKTIFELKQLMKTLKLSKYYCYIYSIYFDIKGKKLINLSVSDIHSLLNQFIYLERKMKIENIKQTSLNVIIYILMKQKNIPGYQYVILPKNIESIEY